MIGAFYQPANRFADLTACKRCLQRELSARHGPKSSNTAHWAMPNFCLVGRKYGRPDGATSRKNGGSRLPLLQNEGRYCCPRRNRAGHPRAANLGHTFGHAIEAEMGYGVWLHGGRCRRLRPRFPFVANLGQNPTGRHRPHCRFNGSRFLPSAPPVFSFEKWIEHAATTKKSAAASCVLSVWDTWAKPIPKLPIWKSSAKPC